MRYPKRTPSGHRTGEAPSIAQGLKSTLWPGIDPAFAGVDEASFVQLHRATRYQSRIADPYDDDRPTRLVVSYPKNPLPETTIILRESTQSGSLAEEVPGSNRRMASLDTNSSLGAFDGYPEDLAEESLIVDSRHGARAGGAFADVYRGRYQGNLVAVKAIRRINEIDPFQMNRKFEREARIWWTLKHVNVLPLLGFIMKPDLSPYKLMISPWCENGNLAEYMKKNPKMPYSLRIDLFHGIVVGLQYLHSRASVVVHGDLKPANILLDRDWTPKLADFGLVRVIHEGPPSGYTPISNHLGTIRYTAPELLQAKTDRQWWAVWARNDNTQVIIRPTTSSDIYAMGSIGMEIMTSTKPYAHISGDGLNATLALLNEIKAGRPPARRPSNTQSVIDLLWREVFEPTWRKKPLKRPTAGDLFILLEAVRKDPEFS